MTDVAKRGTERRCGGLMAVLAALLLTAVTAATVAVTHELHGRVDLAPPAAPTPAAPVLFEEVPGVPELPGVQHAADPVAVEVARGPAGCGWA